MCPFLWALHIPRCWGSLPAPGSQLSGEVWWGLGCHTLLCSPQEGRIVSHLLLGVLPGPLVPPWLWGCLGSALEVGGLCLS